ncbi:family lipoprotein : ApbE family lipoprotein OS=Pirellula staleyi (strain ATCC 27377 / DSM 6068 / ICPB 4128) GN=Psta_0073 PE=4 SV=1: ApbE [Gemmataceae bacterium]|nr:family lipoprotein : ApbE family lipoprotein OS=Pirellula staleyi (strain ATCC 27377 / DSM 6068 / ICPB 4128) GN=Psta_0073 PE=4 SV=1: ApbE [Gemmataceae bacterium]VTT97671.1 family lipoprotein : ApbE family lipoprotein OS=Pirellula staleyi (strain ATCC 27377 / DSM 6068 / ICPB 4128) GN=Psta_0073 PE=4 SV=1: ApbE [Gemmataceae bacterium]
MFDLFCFDEPEAPPGEFVLVRVSRRAMATTFEVAVPVGAHRDSVGVATTALDLIDELEDQMTVYRDHSEVSRLNAAAADAPVGVEELLFELFERCAGWTHETEGAFDVATGAITKAWGFYSRVGRVPTPPERIAAMRRTGFRHVVLNPEARTVKFRVPGLELNLGAVGKGYALDRAAELLRESGVASALLHGGGSSVYAIGHPPGDARGWPVRLRHPTDTAASLGTVYLRNQGLGTSAATFQFFEYKGQKLGHLLDPRLGWPARGVQSTSVVAPTAAEADAMSTAAFVLGASGTERLLRLKPNLAAVVLPDAPATPTAFNFRHDSFTPATADRPT